MEINGIQLVFLGIPAEYTEEYNRWYDLDHMPEHVSKDDVIMGRRYVADRSLRDLPASFVSDAFGGHPPYLSIYWFGGPLDMASEEARQGWRTKDRGIVKQGRYWLRGHVTGGGMFRVAETMARPSVLVAKEAVAHLNHRGVIVAYGKTPSLERRDEAVSWWWDTHLVDLFAVPGVLAALRCDPVERDQDHVLHLILCEDSPVRVMPRIDATLRYQGAVGRWPAYGGVYEPVAFLPYERIVPLEYGFDFGD
jgi:hypothetical protein